MMCLLHLKYYITILKWSSYTNKYDKEMEGLTTPPIKIKYMKDFMLCTYMIVNGINLIVSEQSSDLMKCTYFILFIIASTLWLLYSESGRNLLDKFNSYQNE